MPRPKVALKTKPAVTFRAYPIVSRAVEEGIAYGWHRAFKHDGTPIEEEGPRAANARDAILNAVMSELCEVMEFDPEEGR